MDPLYCTACGHELRPGDLFCTACGVPAEASAGPATGPAAGAAPLPAPRAGRPVRSGRRRAAGWVVAVVAALTVVTGAYALGTATAGHTTGSVSAQPPTGGGPTAGATDGDPGDGATGPSGTASPSVSPAALAQARALHDLLTHSAADKKAIAVAASQLQGCRHLPRAIRAFQSAAASRQRLVTKAAGLQIGLLPGGGEAVASLSQALRAAADADDAYVAWGQARHRVGSSCRGGKALRAQAVQLSAASHAPKQAAADAWNVIAAQTGLPAITWTSL